MTKPLTATLGELAGPRLERIVHPTTGQELVPAGRRRIVRGPAFLRRGGPLNLAWAAEQAHRLAAKGRDAAHIARVFNEKGGVTRGDGSPVMPEDVEGWLRCED